MRIFLLVVLLCAFYAVADYFTGNGIDESVLYHLQVGVEGAGVAAYKWLVVVVTVVLAVVLIVAFIAFTKITRRKRQHSLPALVLAAALLSSSVAVNPASHNLYSLWQIIAQGQRQITLPESHWQPVSKTPEAPLNVVVLYLESLERTYLNNDAFPDLTPNLNHWESKGTYFTDT